MEPILLPLTALSSAAVTALITWLIAARRTRTAHAETARQRERAATAEARLEAERQAYEARLNSLREAETAATTQRERAGAAEARLEAERNAFEARLSAMQDTEQRLRDVFASLSSSALQASTDQFLKLAQERMDRQQQAATGDLARLVEPLRATLERQEQQVQELERSRQAAYGSLTTLLGDLRQDQQALRTQTDNLIQSLRNPRVRGRWGEFQLRKLVELAGMVDHCDFIEQQNLNNDDERRQRPDMVVRLPNDRQIIVDAKVPLDRFLTALEATEDQRGALFRDHAQTVRKHVDETTKRAYYKQLPGAHEFTVIFIPGELFYHTALEYDHELLDYAFARNVIIAGPGTLIAVLKSAALGWREASLSREARKIQEEGRKVYESLGKVTEHLSRIGSGLGTAVKGYNDAVGSIEERLLPRARRLHELRMSEKPPAEIVRVDAELRTFRCQDLTAIPDDDVFLADSGE